MPIVEVAHALIFICAYNFNRQSLRIGYDAFKQHGHLPYKPYFGYTYFETYFGRPTMWVAPMATQDQLDNGLCLPVLYRCKSKMPVETLFHWPKYVPFAGEQSRAVDSLHCSSSVMRQYGRRELVELIMRRDGPFKAQYNNDLEIYEPYQYLNMTRRQFMYVLDEYIRKEQGLPNDVWLVDVNYPTDAQGPDGGSSAMDYVCRTEEESWILGDADDIPNKRRRLNRRDINNDEIKPCCSQLETTQPTPPVDWCSRLTKTIKVIQEGINATARHGYTVDIGTFFKLKRIDKDWHKGNKAYVYTRVYELTRPAEWLVDIYVGMQEHIKTFMNITLPVY